MKRLERWLLGLMGIVAFVSYAATLNGCGSCRDCLNSENLSPENLGPCVNTKNDEFAPLLLADSAGLLFTSDRGGGTKKYMGDKIRYGEDLFVSRYEEGRWSDAELLRGSITTPLNEGTPALAADGRTAIIARSHEADGMGGSDLYSASFDGTTFSNIVNLGPTVNSKYWDAQPTLSPDGNILVFVSDRDDAARGTTDLYMCIRQKEGGWSAPVDLGPQVNTAGNEYSPSFASDGVTLFFASDGKSDGAGKLDLHFTVYQGSANWSEPRSLGQPFNSNGNDAFPFATKDRKALYFASDRPGGCGGYDLYAAPLRLPSVILAGTVRDTTGNPIELGTEVVVVEKQTSIVAAKMRTVPPGSTYETALAPGATYTVRAVAQGYYPSALIEVTAAQQTSEQRIVRDITLVPLPRTLVRKGTVEFDLKSYEIPFFVTGYYRLNTRQNLSELRDLQKSRLKEIDYIEKPGPEYDRYAIEVEKIFNDSLKTALVNTVLPAFRKLADPKEYLQFEVIGYADPRPISGKYVEDDVSFGGIAVRRSDPMNNQALSTLRAYYSMTYIDGTLSDSPDYQALRSAGRIEYTIRGAGVDITSEKALEARRRVRVVVSRLSR